MMRKAVGCLVGAWLLASVGCADDGKKCGFGTTEKDGKCVADAVSCGAGEIDVDGKCLPVAFTCATGSTLNADGICVADLVCGNGTHADDGNCVPNELPTPDVTESLDPDGEVAIILPAAGGSLALGGVIDTPVDINEDGYSDADWDRFIFTAEAGTYLRITALSEGALLPAFRLMSAANDDTGWPRFMRWGLDTSSARSSREVYLPFAGEYILDISDYNHALRTLRHEPVLAVGGDDFTYVATLENLGEPNAVNAVTLPRIEEGTFDSGRLRFVRLDNLAPGSVTAAVFAADAHGEYNDVIGAFLVLDQTGQVIADNAAGGTSDSADVLLQGRPNVDYLMVIDHWAVLGSRRDYRISIHQPTLTDCHVGVCEGGEIPADDTNLYRWTLDEGDFLVVGAFVSPDAPYPGMVQLFDTDLKPISDDTILWDPAFFPVTLFKYADRPMTVYLWSHSYTGGPLPEYYVTHEIAATPELRYNQTNSNLPVHPMPEGQTFWPAGIDHFEANVGQLVFFYQLTPHDGSEYAWLGTDVECWTDFDCPGGSVCRPDLGRCGPLEFIMTSEMEQIGPVVDVNSWAFPDAYIFAPFAYISKTGHYLHWVTAGGYTPPDGTYDVYLRLKTPASIGKPSVGTPVGLQNQGLGGGSSFFTIEAEEMQWIDITVTPTPAISHLVPEIWIYNFGEATWDWVLYRWIPDAAAGQLGLVASFCNEEGGDCVDVSQPLTASYISPYAGRSVVMVMDAIDQAATLDTFNIEVTALPRPANDTCVDAEAITLESGVATVSASLAGASNSVSDLPAAIPDDSCYGFYGRGPERFYRLDLIEGDTLTVDAAAEFGVVINILKGCELRTLGCVTEYTSGAFHQEYQVPTGGAGSYTLIVDSGATTGDVIDAAGEFELNVSVTND